MSGTGGPTVPELREAFGLVHLDDRSLSWWSTVHRGRTTEGLDVVVKRTAPTRERAEAMATWVRSLAAAGVAVVTPVPLHRPNPAPVGDAWWVVYPFVEGEPYTGTTEQLRALGDWLGRQHAAPVPAGVEGLRRYAYPTTTRAEVDADLETLGRRLPDDSVVRALADRWLGSSLPALREADLPVVPVSGDVKANNLVFTADGPVLVDPDNGGVDPRVLDLALAAVLLHNETPTAPPRLPDAHEWRTLATAYLAHVDLTDDERRLWPAALDHVLWEEGTWALEDNDDAAWADPHQGAFLRDLAVAGPERFPLPS